jgi:hypothetical protein
MLSENGCETPEKEFSIPGPPCGAKTPIVLPFVERLIPSAIPAPTRSCRQMTGRMPSSAQRSISRLRG